jgi:hypothetical protein
MAVVETFILMGFISRPDRKKRYVSRLALNVL